MMRHRHVRSKKGSLWTISLTVGFLLAILAVYTGLFAKYQNAGVLGEKAFFLFATHDRLEEKRLGEEAKIAVAAHQAIADLLFYGFAANRFLDSPPPSCGTAFSWTFWNTQKKDCYPTAVEKTLQQLMEYRLKEKNLLFSITPQHEKTLVQSAGQKPLSVWVPHCFLRREMVCFDDAENDFLSVTLYKYSDSIGSEDSPDFIEEETLKKELAEERIERQDQTLGEFVDTNKDESLLWAAGNLYGSNRKTIQYEWGYEFPYQIAVQIPFNMKYLSTLSQKINGISQGYTSGSKQEYVKNSFETIFKDDPVTILTKHRENVLVGNPTTWYTICEDAETGFYNDLAEFITLCSEAPEDDCSCSMQLQYQKEFNMFAPNYLAATTYHEVVDQLQKKGIQINLPSFEIQKEGVQVNDVLLPSLSLVKSGNTLKQGESSKKCTIHSDVYKTCVKTKEYLYFARNYLLGEQGTHGIIRFGFVVKESPPPPVEGFSVGDVKNDDAAVLLQWKKSSSVDTVQYAIYISNKDLKLQSTQELKEKSQTTTGDVRRILVGATGVASEGLDLSHVQCDWKNDKCTYQYKTKAGLVSLQKNTLYQSDDFYYYLLPAADATYVGITAVSKSEKEIDNVGQKMPAVLAQAVDDLAPGKVKNIQVDSSPDLYELSFPLPPENIDGSPRELSEKLTYDLYWKDCSLEYTDIHSLKELTNKPPLQVLKVHVDIAKPCFTVVAVDENKNPAEDGVERDKLLE